MSGPLKPIRPRDNSLAGVSTAICMVGFGEVTQTWLDTLLSSGYPREALTVLYIPHNDQGMEKARRLAAECGVRLVHAPGEVPRDVAIFVNATHAGGIESVFAACLPHLRAPQVWADLVSVAPSVKVDCAHRAAAGGVPYVDIAMMSAAWIHGHRAALWICGPGEAAFAAWSAAVGTPVTRLGEVAGKAATVKMCRSIITKGMAAALIEGLMLGEKNGVGELVLQCVREDLSPAIMDVLCSRFIAGSMLHGERRATELLNGSINLAEVSHWQERTIRSTANLLHFIGTSGGREVAGSAASAKVPLQLIAEFIAQLDDRPAS
jgi:3-hydroxyisobutyrate dehydrogenase-like beta-hydroxyacid dehydrogenase